MLIIAFDCSASVGESYKQQSITSELQLNAAKQLIKRVLPKHYKSFKLGLLSKENDRDVFELYSENNKIVLNGSSGVAIASALNYYLKHYCNCLITYCGKNLELPNNLPKIDKKVKVNNLYKHRVYYNYCTLSYTAAWWDWKRWEQEIDYLALNGINMPLSVIGLEAVWYNTLLKFKYTDEEARKFLVGPAFFAWQWMTNIQSHGGPLPLNWIKSHILLGQKILKRQRELGMTPIQQGFTGSLPKDFKEKFPNIKFKQGKRWCSFPTVPGQLDPLDPMFKKFGTSLLAEQKRLFGSSHIYAVDPFHEGSPPDSSKKYLNAVGKAICELITSVDSKAVCAMQSWSIREPIATVFPKDRLLILDLGGFKDQITNNFWGYEYVKGQLHNFGGRINMHGDLRHIASNPFATTAKAVPNCVGVGLFMEGMVQNPVFYQIVLDQFWNDKPVNINDWLKRYITDRYGVYSDSTFNSWKILLDTAYTWGTTGVENSSIICARPALDCKKSGPNAGFKIPYKPEKLSEALKLLLSEKNELKNSDGYRYDVVDLTRQILTNLAQEYNKEAALAFKLKDKEKFALYSQKFLGLLKDVDTLLSTREEFSFPKWVKDARSWGSTESEKNYYEWNASMLLTIWGDDKNPIIFDYAWREWAGLIDSYYFVRWKMFYDYLAEKLENGEEYSDPTRLVFGREALRANSFYSKLANYELNWCKTPHQFPKQIENNSIAVAEKIFSKYLKDIKYIYSDLRKRVYSAKVEKLTKGMESKSGVLVANIEIKKNGAGNLNKDIDITKHLESEGEYNIVVFADNKTDVVLSSVSIFQDQQVKVANDKHKTGFTASKNAKYLLKLPTFAFGAKYTLRLKFKLASGNNKVNFKVFMQEKKD
jgi:alpha-N-acetylglucosaminidase